MEVFNQNQWNMLKADQATKIGIGILIYLLHSTNYIKEWKTYMIANINNLNCCFLVLRNALWEISPIRSGLDTKPVILTSQFFQGLALCLRDKEWREDSEKPENYKMDTWGIHEQRKNLHDMVQPGIRSPSISQGTDQRLGNDWPSLPCGSTDAMSCWAIPGRENLTRNNEGRCVRTEILEKVAETIERK